MLFPKRSLATAVAMGTMQLATADLEYPVYFDGAPYPNGRSNPKGGNGDPKKPKDWDEVDQEAFPFDYYKMMNDRDYKYNQCENRSIEKCGGEESCYDNRWYKDRAHKQSPIVVQYDSRVAKCDDRHEFHTPVDGRCEKGDVEFSVTPTGLLAQFDCGRMPTLDMSRNPNEWDFNHIEVKVPGEHKHKLDNGSNLSYPGELHLVHKGGDNGNRDDIGIVAVWLDAKSSYSKNSEFERYIDQWEKALQATYDDCGMTLNVDSCDGGGDGGGCSSSRREECCSSRRELSDDWDVIVSEDFEPYKSRTYFGKFTDGGGDDLQTLRYGKNLVKDTTSVRLRKSAALDQKDKFDATKYRQLRVEFYFITTGVERDERLDLELWDGYQWEHIQSWTNGNGVSNGEGYEEEVVIRESEVNFTSQAKFRFKTNGSGNSDKWYLDDIKISGSNDESSGGGGDDGDGDGDGDGGGGGNTCSSQEIEDCCGRRRLDVDEQELGQEQNQEQPFPSLLRGATRLLEEAAAAIVPDLSEVGIFDSRLMNTDKTSSYNTSAVSESRHPNRRLEYRCRRNEGDYFCPYSLYEDTENPYYHRYYGSLTTPPCTESVRWRVMIDPLKINSGQLHRIEMLIAKYVDKQTCKLGTWGKPRAGSQCKVDVNRPLQYLSRRHKVEDCEKHYDGKAWSFESTGLELQDIDAANNSTMTSTTVIHPNVTATAAGNHTTV